MGRYAVAVKSPVHWARRCCGAVLAAVLLSTALPAAAQDSAELAQRVKVLEKQLQAVQRRVFRPDTTYFATPDSGTAPVQTGAASASPLLADLAVRIDALERQLRELTGQIEEVQHQNRTLANRLARFEQDVALRLQATESAGGGPASGTTLPGAEGTTGSATEPGSAPADALVVTRTPEQAAALIAGTKAPDTAGEEKAGAVPASPAVDPAKEYEAAYDLLRRGQIAEAEQAFRAFLAAHRDHPLAGNAQYWLGETYYVRRDYARAAQAFLTGYQDYGKSGKAPDSLLKLAMSLAALGQTDDACAAFEQLETSYPDAEDRIKRRMAVERARIGCS